MKKKNVEFIKQEHLPECRGCNGTGKGKTTISAGITVRLRCDLCKGTGKFDNSSYHMIVTKPDGTKIGFAVDDAGK